MNRNHFILTGHLTRDPELRRTVNGTPCVTYTAASNVVQSDDRGKANSTATSSLSPPSAAKPSVTPSILRRARLSRSREASRAGGSPTGSAAASTSRRNGSSTSARATGQSRCPAPSRNPGCATTSAPARYVASELATHRTPPHQLRCKTPGSRSKCYETWGQRSGRLPSNLLAPLLEAGTSAKLICSDGAASLLEGRRPWCRGG
jgi:hypothetical protein